MSLTVVRHFGHLALYLSHTSTH